MANSFLGEVLIQLLEKQIVHKDMKLLVMCGGVKDANVLRDLGFRFCTISNVDTRMTGNEFSPFEWSFQDAENLTFKNKEFDFGIVHEGLHHCYSPHRALLELYRVTKDGIMLFEPCDNVLSKFGVKLGFGQDFEHAAVFYNDCEFGGVQNTKFPNFIYRWTEEEVRKTIQTCDPYVKTDIRFFYKMVLPWKQIEGRKNPWVKWIVKGGLPALKIFTFLFPRQCNSICAVVMHSPIPETLHPWLQLDKEEICLNQDWLQKRYKA
ncbi:MAG: hypothetical protein DHS20C09_09110 [marine bacterium B5-7]|nr:MAG: hypothetical protein DHS20C09_09110 [marine bacterium B5-7]